MSTYRTRRTDNAGRVGLKLNAGKCKVMRTNSRREDKVKFGNEQVEDVEEFVYLSATNQIKSDQITLL